MASKAQPEMERRRRDVNVLCAVEGAGRLTVRMDLAQPGCGRLAATS